MSWALERRDSVSVIQGHSLFRKYTMNAQPVSSNDVESTRKIGARLYSEFLQRLADVTQERAADFMGLLLAR